MRILMQSLNFAPELVGIGPYSSGIAEAFAQSDHDVHVVCAKPYYPSWSRDSTFGAGWRRTRHGEVKVTRCPIYVPASPSGSRRILHHASFGASALVPMLSSARARRPDLVLAVVPSLLAAPVAFAAARMSGAPLWLHIQDFEVDAAQATGLMRKGGGAARLADRLERSLLAEAAIVTSISQAMCERTRAKGVPYERIAELRNWAEIDDVRPGSRMTALRREWGLSEQFIALYSGNIARKQGIEVLVDAARKLHDREDIVFVICGDGPNRAYLEGLSSGLANVRLKPLQPRARLPELLATSDIGLLPQLAGAADLVLPSKLANMLAAGRPVIATAAPGTGIWNEVGPAGRCTPPGNAQALADAVRAAADDPEWRAHAGAEARIRALARWSRGPLLAEFVALAERAVLQHQEMRPS